MTTIKTVYLHGALGDKYGQEHHFALNCPREAVAALSANFPGFRADFFEYPFYGIICDGDNRHEGNCADVAEAPFAVDIHLVPMIEGRLGIFVPLLAFFSITGVAATLISGALVIGLLYGVSMLLAPKPPDMDEKRDENYMFSGPDNVISQGAAVPLIYGRCFVGSVVISSGLEVAEGTGEGEGEGRNYLWKTQGGEVSHHKPGEEELSAPGGSAPDRDTIWRAVNA